MSGQLRTFLEMIRFSHTIFALPFAMLAAVMAWKAGWSELEGGTMARQILGILLCMVFARTAAMAFNRLADRDVDADNPRTAARHIPAGILSPARVGLFTVVSSAGFVASTLLFLPNWLPIALSMPVLLFLLGYSYTKRFTSLAHFYLGAALMLAPVCTWIALRGTNLMADPAELLPTVCLGLGILLWVSGFDIIYACQDEEFDRKAKLRSVPARLGTRGALRVAAICHLAMFAALMLLPMTHRLGGPDLGLGWIYWGGVCAVGGLLFYEHLLVRPDDLTRVNVAFFNVNAIVSIGLFVIGSIDLII